MKLNWPIFFLTLPCAALAFQQAATPHYRDIQDGTLDRAEHCATIQGTIYDFCDVEELETLADELEHFQGSYQKKVCDILRSQTELKRLVERYAVQSKPEPSSNNYLEEYMQYHW